MKTRISKIAKERQALQLSKHQKLKIDTARKKQLDKVLKDNVAYYRKKIQEKEHPKKVFKPNTLSELEKLNTVDTSNFPQVSAEKLLVLLYCFKAKSRKTLLNPIEQCVKLTTSDHKILWDSTKCLLEALRLCILDRNWEEMVEILIELLQHRQMFMHFVQNACKIMVKFNPLVKKYGLEQQFKLILGEDQGDIITV